jgi:hypothetical protein
MIYRLAHNDRHEVAVQEALSSIACTGVILRPISQYCAASTYTRAPRHVSKATQARAPRDPNILIPKHTHPKTVNSDAPYGDVRLHGVVIVALSPPGAIAALS